MHARSPALPRTPTSCRVLCPQPDGRRDQGCSLWKATLTHHTSVSVSPARHPRASLITNSNNAYSQRVGAFTDGTLVPREVKLLAPGPVQLISGRAGTRTRLDLSHSSLLFKLETWDTANTDGSAACFLEAALPSALWNQSPKTLTRYHRWQPGPGEARHDLASVLSSWAGHLTVKSLSFPIYKMGLTVVPPSED